MTSAKGQNIRDHIHALGEKLHFPSAGALGIDATIRLRNTPDWLRRGIRLSLCLTLFGLLGHAIEYPPEWGANLQSEVKQACNWAAITCIVSDHCGWAGTCMHACIRPAMLTCKLATGWDVIGQSKPGSELASASCGWGPADCRMRMSMGRGQREQHAHVVTPFGLVPMGSSWLVPLPPACTTTS